MTTLTSNTALSLQTPTIAARDDTAYLTLRDTGNAQRGAWVAATPKGIDRIQNDAEVQSELNNIETAWIKSGSLETDLQKQVLTYNDSRVAGQLRIQLVTYEERQSLWDQNCRVVTGQEEEGLDQTLSPQMSLDAGPDYSQPFVVDSLSSK
jgi:hypothetical protein